jgi:tripartite-type tricarboxylate transporter receptor subunit TctC
MDDKTTSRFPSLAGTSAHSVSRRRLLKASAGLAVLGATGALRAQPSYPQRPITLIVPFPAGGGTDVTARAVARILSESLGQQVIVDNRPGAAGSIGTGLGARAQPDGYTLVFGTTGTHTVNQTLYPKLPYDPVDSFAPVSMVCRYNNVLAAHPSFPASDMAGFLREVRANPGKYFYAISTNGSSGHLASELLRIEAKLDVQGVPYKGAAEAMNDFMSGRVPLMCDTVINQLQNIRAGKVKALATTGPQRSPVLPAVPTVAESGFPGFQAVGWAGVFAPAVTPQPIVDRLSEEIRKNVNSPLFDSLTKSGLELFVSTPEEMRAFVVSETAKWRKVIQAAGIKAS